MTRHRFVVANVFTDRALAGSPLAVFPDASSLDELAMHRVARDLGYSTTLVVPPRRPEALWRLRCFTPLAEVFAAGHHALGAWWVLAATGRLPGASPSSTPIVVHQELGNRVLPVRIARLDGSVVDISMSQELPVLGGELKDLGPLSQALGISLDAIQRSGLRPCSVSTGAPHLLVAVDGLETLRRLRVDQVCLLALVRSLRCQGVYVFTLQTVEPDSIAHARAFYPAVGIAEDPATGTAAGPLAAYLAGHGLLTPGTTATIEQGDEAGRPSRIQVRADREGVHVGGRAVIVGEGHFLL